MFILAGLPPATANRARNLLQERFPQGQVISIPASSSDGALYPYQQCAQLVEGVTQFVIRRRTKSADTPVAPSFIQLLYVPAPDDEALLQSFDFAVMPVPLTRLLGRDQRGRQARHDPEIVQAAIDEAVAASSPARAALNLVRERLARLSNLDILSLPPANFHLGEERLTHVFRQFRRGQREWTDRAEDLGPAELTHEHSNRIKEGVVARVFVDTRGNAFPIAHKTAFHAPPRQQDEHSSMQKRTSVLRTLYRFGSALEFGLHHDVHSTTASRFTDEKFVCDTEGEVVTSSTHANIYSNDFVRADDKRPFRK